MIFIKNKISKFQVFLFAIALLGTSFFFLHPIYIPNPTIIEWVLFLVLVSAVFLLNKYRIYLPLNRNSLIMDSSIYIACLFIFGLEKTLAVLVLGSTLFAIYDKVAVWWKHLFNITMFIITITGTYYMFILFGGEIGPLNIPSTFPYLLALATYYSINLLIITIYFFLLNTSISNFIAIFNEVSKEVFLNYVITLALAFILAIILESNPIFGTLFFVFVLILSSLSFLKYFNLYSQLDQEKVFQEQILNSLPVGIITVDNRTSAYSLNAAASSLLQRNTLNESPSDQDKSANKEFWSILTSKEKVHNRKVIYKSDETPYLLLVSQTPLYDQHKNHVGKIIFFIDITETAEMEERMHQSEKLALLGELAAGAAHEIRNPLTVVQGFLSLMNNSFSNEDQKKFHFPLMFSEFDRINSIIDEMLLLAKPGAPIFKEVKILKTISEITSFYKKAEETKNLNFEIQLDDVSLLMDEMQIKQVLHNLIRNSSDAMDGKGTISFRSSIDNNSFHLHISDNGEGIPDFIKEDIFNPFATSKETGTGLGLTIVQRIIENHSGEIQLLSSSTEGTTFSISLPLREALTERKQA